jgi:hypothetical protein
MPHYDLIDFVAVLIGYILSGEPTLLAFYEQLAPWTDTFMPFLVATVCLIVPPCLGFWRLLINRQ